MKYLISQLMAIGMGIGWGWSTIAQTPPLKPVVALISALQSPNTESARAIAQQNPAQRPKLLPQGIIQIVRANEAQFAIANTKSEGNRLTLTLNNATLKDQKSLQIQNPYPGIAQVTLSRKSETVLELAIVGEKSLPTASWSPFEETLTITACSFGFLPVLSTFQGEGSTRLLYDVDANGCPQNIQIAQSSGRADFDAWAVGELRRRQFQPNRPMQALRLRMTYELEGSAFYQQRRQGVGIGNSSPTSPTPTPSP